MLRRVVQPMLLVIGVWAGSTIVGLVWAATRRPFPNSAET